MFNYSQSFVECKVDLADGSHVDMDEFSNILDVLVKLRYGTIKATYLVPIYNGHLAHFLARSVAFWVESVQNLNRARFVDLNFF
jgi:hypothetical protein